MIQNEIKNQTKFDARIFGIELSRWSKIRPNLGLGFCGIGDVNGLKHFERASECFSCRLSGLSPFMGHNYVETMTNVTHNEYDFDDEAFDEVSEEVKNFIEKLLVLDKR